MKRFAAALCVVLTSPLWSEEPPVAEYYQALDRAAHFLTRTHGNPLGIDVAAIEPTLRAQLGIEEGEGIVVTGLAEGEDAATLGLKQHDILLELEDETIASPEQFHELIGNHQGKKIRVRLVRQGKPKDVTLPVPRARVYALFEEVDQEVKPQPRYRIGVALAEADDTLRSQLKLAAGEGLVVTSVVDDSPAAKAGIKPHDVLTKLDNRRLSTSDSVNEQIQGIKDRQVTLVYLRGGQETSCTIAPQISDAVGPRYTEELLRTWVRKRAGRDADLEVRSYPSVFWRTPAFTADAAAQLAELKKQLLGLQKTIESLETALQPPKQDKE
jgi:C-terminal processing protease CtpA/Prc